MGDFYNCRLLRGSNRPKLPALFRVLWPQNGLYRVFSIGREITAERDRLGFVIDLSPAIKRMIEDPVPESHNREEPSSGRYSGV